MSDLQSFVREALAAGISRAEIQGALREAGWREDEIAQELHQFADVAFPLPVPRPRRAAAPLDAFLYLVLFLALYTTAIALGSLLFTLIENWMPDPVADPDPYAAAARLQSLRWSSAAVITGYPLLWFVTRLLGRAHAGDPERRRSPARRWLTYITLFVAAAVILGDLVTLIYNLLGGELGGRFLLKTVTVGAISGTVFGYYLLGLRTAESTSDNSAVNLSGNRARGFERITTIVVVFVIAAALVFAGPPERARQDRADLQRSRDLRTLSTAVHSFYDKRGRLPGSLEELKADAAIQFHLEREGPEPDGCRYLQTGATTYELSTVFETDTTRKPASEMEDRVFGRHTAGQQRFPLDVPLRRP